MREEEPIPYVTEKDECPCIHSEIQQTKNSQWILSSLLPWNQNKKVMALFQKSFSTIDLIKGNTGLVRGIFINVTTETGSVHFWLSFSPSFPKTFHHFYVQRVCAPGACGSASNVVIKNLLFSHISLEYWGILTWNKRAYYFCPPNSSPSKMWPCSL